MPLSLEIMASFHHASRKWPQMALFFYNILFLSLGNDLAQTARTSQHSWGCDLFASFTPIAATPPPSAFHTPNYDGFVQWISK